MNETSKEAILMIDCVSSVKRDQLLTGECYLPLEAKQLSRNGRRVYKKARHKRTGGKKAGGGVPCKEVPWCCVPCNSDNGRQTNTCQCRMQMMSDKCVV